MYSSAMRVPETEQYLFTDDLMHAPVKKIENEKDPNGENRVANKRQPKQ